MNVLQLNDSGTKIAMQHPALKGLPLLGRGKFSVVLDGGDRALHLTTDRVSYAMHCDTALKCSGVHFSEVLEDFGSVGVQKRNNISLYLFATEKLVPLQGWVEQRRLAKKLQTASGFAHSDWCLNHAIENYSNSGAAFMLRSMHHDSEGWLPPSIMQALRKLEVFCHNSKEANLDLHAANFMVRPSTGELVFNDPLCDTALYSKAYLRLSGVAA